jgi:hypothetical protein
MEPRLAAMTAALRVLTAINEKRHPDQADISQLRGFSNLPAHTAIEFEDLLKTLRSLSD